MSRSELAHKKQLALSVAKGKRVELEVLLDNIRGREVPGIQNVIVTRIEELKDEIKDIEGWNGEPVGKINEAV